MNKFGQIKENIAEKWKNFLARGPVLWRTLKLVWAAAPGWTSAWLGVMLMQSLLPMAQVYLLRFTINSLVNTISGQEINEMIRTGAGWVVLYAILMLINVILGNLGHWIQASQSELVNDYINKQIHLKFLEIDYAYFEVPDFYDRVYRARNIGKYHALGLVSVLGNLLSSTITMFTMAGVILAYGVVFPILLFVSTIPMIYIISMNNRKEFNWTRDRTEDMRRADYYDYLLSARESIVDVRMYGLGSRIMRLFQDLRKTLRTERLNMVRKQSTRQTLAAIFSLLIASGGLAWMAIRVLRGETSLGDMALYYSAFNMGQSLVNAMVHSAGNVFNNVLNMSNFFEFIDLKPQLAVFSAENPEESGDIYRREEKWLQIINEEPVMPPLDNTTQRGVEISVENIDFAYPGSDYLVLQDFSLKFPAGSVTAIIGDNGAGKSTLIKMLCRLFDPSAGRILWNGVDYRALPLNELQAKITTLFPVIMYYQATVRENICMTDIDNFKEEDVIRAAKDAGALDMINHFSKGFDTQLGKWFTGGTELSSGQWQRIALARALFRPSTLLLLDEPTSNMDAWAEADWYGHLRGAIQGRTTVVITHRLSTAMYCDQIHVMVYGKIVESGTHDELLAMNGRYAHAWQAQMRQKKDEDTAEKVSGLFTDDPVGNTLE